MMNDMKLYHNDLTMDKHSAKQRWYTVICPAVGNANTTKHDCQMYVIMCDGTYMVTLIIN